MKKRYNFISDYKRADNGLMWEHYKRMNKYNRLNNEGYIQFNKKLTEIFTFKECEIIFKLPKNTCVRDFKNGLMRRACVRKSGTTYIILMSEAKRLYENYWTERATKSRSHLYCGFDHKKMTEKEFMLKFGDEYKACE